MARGQEFAGRLLWATFQRLPEKYRDQWNGGVAVDGTTVIAAQTGTSKRSSRCSSEPDAYWYIKEGDHRYTEDKKHDDSPVWGYEFTLAAAAMEEPGNYGIPSLIVGAAMDKPGHSPGRHAVDAVQYLTSLPDTPRGYMVGDRAYFPGAKPENIHRPMRERGYKLVGDYRKDNFVPKHTASGAVLVDGQLYCPAMAEKLINASKMLSDDEITRDEHIKLVEQRKPFALRVKGATASGKATILQCPAKANSPSVVCPLAEKIKNPDKAGHINLGLPKVKRPAINTMLKTMPDGARPAVCFSKNSVTIPNTELDKYRQDGPAYGTAEWRTVFGKYRNIIESRNDLFKHSRGSGFGDKTSRLMRGFAAHFFNGIAAAASVNLALIRRFVDRVESGTPCAPKPPTPPQDTLYTSQEDLDQNLSHAPPVSA